MAMTKKTSQDSPTPSDRALARDISAIADRVLAARTVRGLGSRELARLAGMSSAATSRVENYRRGISVQTVFRLADALKVRRAWLVTGDGKMDEKEK